MSAWSAHWRRWAAALAITAFVLVGALLAWPEPPARVLIPADGWQVEGAFVPLEAPHKDQRKSVRSAPEMRYWRSWSPERGSQPGVLRTKPFTPDGPFAVPYNGFAGESGVSAFVECVGSGRRIYLATSRNNTQWSEVLIERPREFCAGDVRVVAVTTSTRDYIALGSPYGLSRLSVLKRSSVGGFWFLIFAWGTMAGWYLLGSRAVITRSLPITPASAGLICMGLIGFAQFFVYWYERHVGLLFSLILVTTGTGALVREWVGRRSQASMSADLRPVVFALCVWLATAVGYFALASMVDSGAGPWEMNGRFTPARWSTDNQLPGFVSRVLVSGNHEDLSDFSVWSLADRPPLSYGWHAALHDIFERLGRLNDGTMLLPTFQLAIGVVLNTVWAAFLALVLPGLGMSRLRVMLTIAILALCPLFIFNSLFTWPKLLSGTLTLAAAWILLGLEKPTLRLRDDDVGLATAAALSALGLLTHGGSAFGILAMLALAVFYRGLPSIRGASIAFAVAVALMLPWNLWQASTHFSGNALVKFAFAGTFGFDERELGVLDTILRSYRELGMEAWLAKKRDGLLTIFFGLRNSCGLNEMGQAHSIVDRWRASDFYNIVPSLNALLLGFIALGSAYKRKSSDQNWQASRRLVVFAVMSVALSWLATWDCFINHHQSYQSLMALHLGLVMALLAAGRWGVVALGLSVLYGLGVWVIEPLGHFPRFDWLSSGVLAALAIITIHQLHVLREPREPMH
ncbi:hypothetical protein [Lysobacter niastensis]|uniref:Glycosyltransferase RgtA/B/C/D-like domain-containing protein n=1 Tax=Lysobacter niastensis TaxID=380629 RepID=A0ABS0BAW2_9GAMM|nr:hypothetical protein [Lysobacter niastensis]MBF6025973.1 hypothetical protein [Lysobacter niastensis]